MDPTLENDPLPMGPVALAKAFCADWISGNSKTLFLSFLTLIVMVVCLFQFTGGLSSGRADYQQVQKAFHAWISEEGQDAKLLKNLEKPLRSHPELEAKFGTLMAQRLLTLGEVSKAGGYAAAALKRAQTLTSPYYTQFSRNTLVISQGKYAEALEKAKQLKVDLEKDDAFWEGRDKFVKSGSILYAYNLLRIASLEAALGSKEGELEAWEELVRNAGWKDRPVNLKTYDPEAYALLARNFTQGDLSLLDFIEQRQKVLREGT